MSSPRLLSIRLSWNCSCDYKVQGQEVDRFIFISIKVLLGKSLYLGNSTLRKKKTSKRNKKMKNIKENTTCSPCRNSHWPNYNFCKTENGQKSWLLVFFLSAIHYVPLFLNHLSWSTLFCTNYNRYILYYWLLN